MSNRQHHNDNPILAELQKQTYLINKLITTLEDKDKKNEKEFYTVSDVSKLVHRSRSTIRRWIYEKKIEGVKLNAGVMQDRYLISKKSLKMLIERNF